MNVQSVLTIILTAGVFLMSGCREMDAELKQHVVAHWSFAVPVTAKLAGLAGKHDALVEGVRASEGGGAWYFPGDTAALRVAHTPELDLVNGFTMEATIRLERLGNPRVDIGVQGILEKHIGKGGWLLIVLRDGRVGYWLETEQGRTEGASTIALTPGKWHHIAMTWDKQKIRLYVDGTPAGEQPFTGPLGRCPQDLYLGNDDTKNWSFCGDIADIRILDIAVEPPAFHRAR
ncbi:MAG TPA: LamG domain-containing protein [Candidatus Latescibacteria bacterium]|nr:LamG domain-containing protein [Candidatus Latescibacterota bacterium]